METMHAERSTGGTVATADGTELDDAALMARVVEDDHRAFALLVDRYRGPLVCYLSRLTGSAERGEELAQEAFVRLYETRSRYREQGRFAAYLYRIAVNLARSRSRRRRRWRHLVPVLTASNGDRPPSAETEAVAAQTRSLVRREVRRLPVTYRAPLLLYEVEGWRYADIAAALDCAEGTIKSRIHRARRMLREALEPHLRGGGEIAMEGDGHG